MHPSDDHYAHWITPAEQQCLLTLLENTPNLDSALVTLHARLKGNVNHEMLLHDVSGIYSDWLAFNPFEPFC